MSALARKFTEEEFKQILLGSFMSFITYFFELKNGRPFQLSHPMGNRSHFLTVCDELEKVFYLKKTRLIINIPPGYAKSTMLVYFIAWCIAHYPDSNFLYISYAFELAEKHTATLKEIITMPAFKYYFGVDLRSDSSSRSNFKTTDNGITRAFGSAGSVTGNDGGLPNLTRFSGMVVIDDPIKPDEAHSDVIRDKIIRNYMETIKSRVRGPNVPIILIGQRVHDSDLSQFLLDGKDGSKWEHIVLAGRDNVGNPLYPEMHGKLTEEEENTLAPDVKKQLVNERAKEWLKTEEHFNRYSFWAQIMQRPVPDGGGIFKKDDFVLLDMEPKIISTMIVIDTAESSKDWADYTVFGFFGIYRLEARGIDLGVYGLHWLDCREVKIEPKDLESEFFDFYGRCMRHKVKPMNCVIEKASTGVTLSSVLKGTQGLRILDIQRTKASGSKTARYYEIQPYIASGRVSFTRGDRHVDRCIEHMAKITSNDSHSHDDICDVVQSAVQCALIEGTLLPHVEDPTNTIKTLTQDFSQSQRLQKNAMQWDYQ